MPRASVRRRISAMSRSLSRSLIGVFALVIVGSTLCMPAQAAPQGAVNTAGSVASVSRTGVHGVSRAVTPDSGQDGTVEWSIDANGVLRFGPGEFAPYDQSVTRNWKIGRSSSITGIVFDDPNNTRLPVNSSAFFTVMTG